MSLHHVDCAAILPLPPSKKLILMAMCDSADKVTGIALPGFEMLRAWSGLGKSQVLQNITELIEAGYLERVSAGRPGHRAEFRVFSGVACCALHAPLGTAILDPVMPDVVPPSSGSGGPDPLDDGSGRGSDDGSGRGSGLGRTPSVSSPSSPSSEGVPTYSTHQGPADRTAPPQMIPGPTSNEPPLRGDRCPQHQAGDIAPPCGACGAARRATEQASTDADRATKAAQAARNRQAMQDRRDAVNACRWCDDDGYLHGHPCDHTDPAERARATAAARAQVRATLATLTPVR